MPVEVKKNNLPNLVAAIKKMTGREVLVGIPSDKAARETASGSYSSFSNASIGFINEFGSPSQNIPARPHLVPGIRSVAADIASRMKEAGQKMLSEGARKGEAGVDINSTLTKIGIIAVGGVQKTIIDILPPPLAKPRPSPKGQTPLIDTGQYLQHISFVLADKDGSHVTLGSMTEETLAKAGESEAAEATEDSEP